MNAYRFGYDESVAGIPRKVACDLDYIRTASFLGDFLLLASTLPHIAQQLYRKWSSDRRRRSFVSPPPRRDQMISIDGLTRQPDELSTGQSGGYDAATSHEERVA